MSEAVDDGRMPASCLTHAGPDAPRGNFHGVTQPKWVLDFSEGSKDMRDLGGKGRTSPR